MSAANKKKKKQAKESSSTVPAMEVVAIVSSMFHSKTTKLKLTAEGLWFQIDGSQPKMLTVDRNLLGATCSEKLLKVCVMGKEKHYSIHWYSFKMEDAGVAETWKDAVIAVSRGVRVGEELPRRRLRVIVNPFSGQKKALSVYAKAKEILAAAALDVDMICTERAGHATDIARELVLDDYDGIVVVSGDGLLWEVINGLMDRDDWKSAISYPIGILPAGDDSQLKQAILPFDNAVNFILLFTGSGNGLAETLGTNSFATSCWSVVKGVTRPLDLGSIRQFSRGEDGAAGALKPIGDERYSFLMLTWGVLSDIDIGSESMRWMGGARFTASGVMRIAQNKRYRGRIAYLPADNVPEERTRCVLSYDECAACHAKDTEAAASSPGAEIDDPDAEDDSATTSPTEHEKSRKGKGRRKKGKGKAGAATATGKFPSIIPEHFDFDNPPEGWVVEEDQFFLVLSSIVSWISYNACFSPFAHSSDGFLDLLLVKKVSRAQLVKVMLALEGGDAFVDPSFEHVNVKARAFVVEPLGEEGTGEKKGILDVDGEQIPTTCTSMEVHRGLLNVMVKSWSGREH